MDCRCYLEYKNEKETGEKEKQDGGNKSVPHWIIHPLHVAGCPDCVEIINSWQPKLMKGIAYKGEYNENKAT